MKRFVKVEYNSCGFRWNCLACNRGGKYYSSYISPVLDEATDHAYECSAVADKMALEEEAQAALYTTNLLDAIARELATEEVIRQIPDWESIADGIRKLRREEID